jgi:Protein of unknown function (DUF3179)
VTKGPGSTTTRQPVRIRLIITGSVLVAAIVALGLDTVIRPTRPRPRTHALVSGYQITPSNTGIIRPPTVAVSVARLPDQEMVIGVKIHGKARAYRRAAFVPILDHVVNDVLGAVPVSVTHCDQTGCTRVFTSDGTEPLELMTGAFMDGLLLKAHGRLYRQDTSAAVDHVDDNPLPYQRLPFEETTWGHWRAENPDTDVYLGRSNPAESHGSGGN